MTPLQITLVILLITIIAFHLAKFRLQSFRPEL